MRYIHWLTLLVPLLFAARFLRADVIDFEGLPDSTVLTTQYPGLIFTNAVILTAGISLNEFEFPPHSGANVASDNGGPMSILFANPISSFGGYFTYAEPLTVAAFDNTNKLVGSVTSNFFNNEALSGVSGSSPNELIDVMFGQGISKITVTGDPLGGSFALDDAVFTPAASAVPEPNTVLLLITTIVLMFGTIRKKSIRS